MNANFINVLSLALNVSKSINKDTKIISSGVAYMYPCDFEYIQHNGDSIFVIGIFRNLLNIYHKCLQSSKYASVFSVGFFVILNMHLPGGSYIQMDMTGKACVCQSLFAYKFVWFLQRPVAVQETGAFRRLKEVVSCSRKNGTKSARE